MKLNKKISLMTLSIFFTQVGFLKAATDQLENVPNEIIVEIFSYLTPEEIQQEALVSKRFLQITCNPPLNIQEYGAIKTFCEKQDSSQVKKYLKEYAAKVIEWPLDSTPQSLKIEDIYTAKLNAYNYLFSTTLSKGSVNKYYEGFSKIYNIAPEIVKNKFKDTLKQMAAAKKF
jgi:hypothetical protein